MVGGIIPLRWATSSRYDGRLRQESAVVRITTVPDTVSSAVEWPSAEQLQELLTIVLKHRPELAPRDEPAAKQQFWDGFRFAFWRIGCMRRSDAPDRRYALGYWADQTKHWLSDHDIEIDIAPGHVFAAALAAGDVCYIAPDIANGVLPELGLSPYTGRAASNAWRDVLASGRLKTPTPPRQRPPSSRPTQPQIFVEGVEQAPSRPAW